MVAEEEERREPKLEVSSVEDLRFTLVLVVGLAGGAAGFDLDGVELLEVVAASLLSLPSPSTLLSFVTSSSSHLGRVHRRASPPGRRPTDTLLPCHCSFSYFYLYRLHNRLYCLLPPPYRCCRRRYRLWQRRPYYRVGTFRQRCRSDCWHWCCWCCWNRSFRRCRCFWTCSSYCCSPQYGYSSRRNLNYMYYRRLQHFRQKRRRGRVEEAAGRVDRRQGLLQR